MIPMAGESTPPSAVLTVDDLVERVRSESVADWERLFGPAVLVGAKPLTFDEYGADFDDEDESPWSFQTAIAGVIPKEGDDHLPSFRLGEVYGLKKASRGVFASTVLLGRASSNDVTIDDASLSKLHARIHLAGDGAMTISDSGSRNGTVLNEKSVDSTATPLADGDNLKLGNRTFRLYDVEHFHRLVARLP